MFHKPLDLVDIQPGHLHPSPDAVFTLEEAMGGGDIIKKDVPRVRIEVSDMTATALIVKGIEAESRCGVVCTCKL